MNMTSKKSGFTLTEILIVLVIAGVLLALILPNSLKAINRSNVVSGDANLKSCNAAIVLCRAEHRAAGDCDTIAKLVAGQFIAQAPIKADGSAYGVGTDATTGDQVCQ